MATQKVLLLYRQIFTQDTTNRLYIKELHGRCYMVAEGDIAIDNLLHSLLFVIFSSLYFLITLSDRLLLRIDVAI